MGKAVVSTQSTGAKLIRVAALRRANKKKQAVALRTVLIKRALRYREEYQKQERELINKRREARLKGDFFREPDPKLVFVIRLAGILGLTPRTRKILQLLRLRRIHNGIFIRANKASLTMLRLVAPYVAYGYPSLKSVRELIYKRGYGKVNHQRVALSSNSVIRRCLGKKGVICAEDLVHQIYTCGRRFRECARFLWPFQLQAPRGGFKRKTKLYVEGGDAGNREELINKLIHRMI
eukprot:TRINITY_DN3250_c0_g1_i4.p1 TRINITY_DN3250_c0_g1~~TRINITY_DN3250_c0_g1_i4.p1  ORF type:complete len:236 (+),score=79.32 TRINITY_DN3250_c0_g1_i4:85-792(+)